MGCHGRRRGRRGRGCEGVGVGDGGDEDGSSGLAEENGVTTPPSSPAEAARSNSRGNLIVYESMLC